MATETFERKFERLEARVAKLETEIHELMELLKKEAENVSFLYDLELGPLDSEEEGLELGQPPVAEVEESVPQRYTEADFEPDAEPKTAAYRQPVL